MVLQGALYHKISALQPPSGTGPAFAQVYIYDTDNELKNRIKFSLSKGDKSKVSKQDREITDKLQKLMHTHSPFVALFKSALERLQDIEAKGESETLKLVCSLRGVCCIFIFL